MKNIVRILFFSFFSSILLLGCSNDGEDINNFGDLSVEEMGSESQATASLSLWLPEWKYAAALKEGDAAASGLKSVRVFGIYFTEEDEPLLTENVELLLRETEAQFGRRNEVILTFVNDIVPEGKKSIQKDSALVHRFVKDEDARKQHIRKIIEVVDPYDIDGIEIDYEEMNQEDMDNYLLFIGELYEVLDEKGLALHVVLQPRFPFEKKFPDGPKYSVMAYNEYGVHSGPGPKASHDFLVDLVRKVEKANQKIDIAFSADGYLWSSGKYVREISTQEAAELIKNNNIPVKRELQSSALNFSFSDETGEYDGWFADQYTLEKWMETVQGEDSSYEHFILWHAGGLGNDTVRWIKDYFE